MNCDHNWVHDYWCQECYYEGREDHYHDQCTKCGEVA